MQRGWNRINMVCILSLIIGGTKHELHWNANKPTERMQNFRKLPSNWYFCKLQTRPLGKGNIPSAEFEST